jgi:nucleotide-binding universal stress UspA family protein
MATILCSTRGGQESYPNQDRAIAIAKEYEADLLFLYVSDVQFLNIVASAVVVDVQKELDKMGEFMLTMAQERAEQAGVMAKTAIRHGVFHHALKELIDEHQVATVVLGSSAGEDSYTTPAYIKELVQWLQAQAGVEVFIVHEGKVLEHYGLAGQNA